MKAKVLTAAALAVMIGASLLGSTAVSAQSDSFDDYARHPDLSGEHADVFRLYWAFFDRKPELAGASYWVGEYDKCISLQDITWSFSTSAEFNNTYGPLSDRDYVTLVYGNVMDRTPDAKGYSYWLNLLGSGAVSRAEMMLYFSLSDEFRRLHPLPSDHRTYRGCTSPAPTPPTKGVGDVYYANCTEVRNAGAAPLHRGERGYRAGLDRDGDGIACEV